MVLTVFDLEKLSKIVNLDKNLVEKTLEKWYDLCVKEYGFLCSFDGARPPPERRQWPAFYK